MVAVLQHVVAARPHGRRSVQHLSKLLVLIFVIALLFRIYWMITQTPVISEEGAEYGRMAENLANGKGLVGNYEGPETLYAPLFPILTAGVYLVTRNLELAAHLVCLIFGTALVIPVFLIARMMYGERVAQISAIVVALHPVFIKLAASIYNEDVYLFLLLMAVYWGLNCLESERKRDYVLLGLCLGLAYLTRPEAFAYPVFFALAVWIVALVTGRIGRRPAIGSALIVGVFVLVALPYIGFLYIHTGHVRLEAKWNIIYTTAKRMVSGIEGSESFFGLNPDNSIGGPLLDPLHFATYTPYPHSLSDKTRTLLAMARRNWRAVYRLLGSSTIGSPFLLGLILLGLLRKSWSPHRLLHESIVLLMAASILFFVLTAPDPHFRYLLPFLPFASLWAGKGIAELAQWSRAVRASLSPRCLPSGTAIGLVLASAVLLLVCGVSWRATSGTDLFVSEQAPYLDVKLAGMWLRTQTGGGSRVASLDLVPYYARATLILLPYAQPADALVYLSSRRPDFIVLNQRDAYFPEVRDWIEHGIPDSRAHLVYESGTKSSNRIQIYRWDDLGAHQNPHNYNHFTEAGT